MENEVLRYVDGFVLPLPKERIADYEVIAKTASEIWIEHGALEYWECVGDDLDTECTRSFTDMTNASDEETVIFAWVIFESREARDAANEKIMADPRMADLMEAVNPLIDYQRMAHGGFKAIVQA
jgi:uncharacterized protein YbaA (DUF1428 family)